MDSSSFGFINLMFILSSVAKIADTKEYCVDEFFEARCAPGDVILVESASYGRMALGRCVTLDLGYLGCHGDAVRILSQWCSGKQTCKRRIEHRNFNGIHHCPTEIHGYLEADYTCHKALQVPSTSCDKVLAVRDQSSLISLNDVSMSGCGTAATPLVLEAKPGQYFNITVLDFTPTGGPHSHGACTRRYGRIRDLSNHRDVPLCSGNGKEKQLMLSNGNTVQLIVDHVTQSQAALLKYTVIGCEDLEPIDGATMHRRGDTLLVECAGNDKAWRLECRDNQWRGTYDKCAHTGDSQTHEETEASEERINNSHELVVIAAGTVVLFASGVIVCVGILYLCHRRSRKPPSSQVSYGYTYNPRTHDVIMHTIQRPRIPDFSGTQQRAYSRQEMPDVVDQTLTRTLPPPVPIPVMGESIYENPGQLTRGSGSCIYSSVHADNPDQPESDYSDSLKYYVLEEREHPSYANTN